MSSVRAHSPGASALWLALAAITTMIPGTALQGQGLPSLAPINPVATSRSGLYFQPYREASRGWTIGLHLDYASMIEYNHLAAAEYILDSELLRLNLTAKHDIGRDGFVFADVAARGAYNGFLDGLLDWYHGVLGIRLREREARPRDKFLYHVARSGAAPVDRASGALFLGDLRVGAGWRYSSTVQGTISGTLPTATGPAGYGRGVISANVIHTVRVPVTHRVVYESSLGVGYTPTYGRLAAVQREVFASATSGLRVGVWGRQALYANLFYHSPYYRETGFPALDREEFSLDFGWLLTTCAGSEWHAGFTEDPKPSGPGVDLVIRFGVVFRTKTAACVGARTPLRQHHGD